MGTPDGTHETDLEHLLDGRRGADGLSRILAAASGPGTARELDGLGAAAAAFAAAEPGPYTEAPRRKSMIKSVLAKLLAAKAAAAVAGTAAMGGVALAASTGALPAPLQNAAHAIGAPAAHTSPHAAAGQDSTTDSADATATAGATDATDATDAADAAEPTVAPTARPTNVPNPSLVGLCHAWSEGEHSKRTTNPAFSVLVTTAGGTIQVSAYCTTLLASVAPHADATPDATDSADSADPSDSPEVEHSHPAEPSHAQDATEGADQHNGQGDSEHSDAPAPQQTQHSTAPEAPESPESHTSQPTHSSDSGRNSGGQSQEHGSGSGDGGSRD